MCDMKNLKEENEKLKIENEKLKKQIINEDDDNYKIIDDMSTSLNRIVNKTENMQDLRDVNTSFMNLMNNYFRNKDEKQITLECEMNEKIKKLQKIKDLCLNL